MAVLDFNIDLKTVNGESLIGSGNISIQGCSFGTDGQIPFMNSDGDDFSYSDAIKWDGSEFIVNQTADNKGIIVNGFDDWSGANAKIYIDQFGRSIFYGSSTTKLSSGGSVFLEAGEYMNAAPASGFRVNTTYMSVGVLGNMGAQLGVRGDGSTSATTNFLLQNSSGTDLFKVLDDGDFTLGVDGTTSTINGRSIEFRDGTSNWLSITANYGGNNEPDIRCRGNTLSIVNNGGYGTGAISLSSKGTTTAYFEDGKVGFGTTSPTAVLDVSASTTSRASLRLRDGVAPTTPNDGDFWSDGSDLFIRLGGTTYTLDKT